MLFCVCTIHTLTQIFSLNLLNYLSSENPLKNLNTIEFRELMSLDSFRNRNETEQCFNDDDVQAFISLIGQIRKYIRRSGLFKTRLQMMNKAWIPQAIRMILLKVRDFRCSKYKIIKGLLKKQRAVENHWMRLIKFRYEMRWKLAMELVFWISIARYLDMRFLIYFFIHIFNSILIAIFVWENFTS